MMFFVVTSCSTESKLEANSVQPPPKISTMPEPKLQFSAPLETGEPAMHAIHNDRLQKVMNQINKLLYSQMSGEINLSQERQLKTEEIARISQELAVSEKAIMETLPALKLNSIEESTFAALAEKLRTSADQMKLLAMQDQLQGVPATLETIISTCTSCHALFRKSRSLLEKCKDPGSTC
jgi:hypothetical protein